MLRKASAVRDSFAFSRGGLTVSASFVPPVVGGDRINRARDEHVRRSRAARRDRADNARGQGRRGTRSRHEAA